MNKKIRDEKIFNLYVFHGFDMRVLAKIYNISHQRVRQILHKTEAQSIVVNEFLASRKEANRLKKIANKKECYVCGKDFQPYSVALSCSQFHQDVKTLLRYQTSNKNRDSARKAAAKRRLSIDNNDIYANNVINGTVGLNSRQGKANQRFMVENTVTFKCAVSAFVLEWPIFDKFHPNVKDQIRTYAREHKNFKVIKHSDLFNY